MKGAFTGADRASSGAFDEADGGTLFLDEIAELPVEVQTQLLRVLEEKRVMPFGTMETRRVVCFAPTSLVCRWLKVPDSRQLSRIVSWSAFKTNGR